jgi:hypothetical protein
MTDARHYGPCGVTRVNYGLRATIIWEGGTKKSRALFISGPSGESRSSLHIRAHFKSMASSSSSVDRLDRSR